MKADYKVNIIIESRRQLPAAATLKKAAQKTLEMEGVKGDVSLNILLTDNQRIKKLNKSYLNRNVPTDVIAFGLKRAGPVNKSLKGFIGEIAISVDMAEINGRQYGNSKADELKLYVVHGILHLLGYDDESPKSRKIMEERQNRIHKQICTSL